VSKFSARYTPPNAHASFPSCRPNIKRLVRATIDALLAKPTNATELTGELNGYWSYRVRRYRIISGSMKKNVA